MDKLDGIITKIDNENDEIKLRRLDKIKNNNNNIGRLDKLDEIDKIYYFF